MGLKNFSFLSYVYCLVGALFQEQSLDCVPSSSSSKEKENVEGKKISGSLWFKVL